MVMSGQSPPIFWGLLPDTEMNKTPSPAIKQHPSKQLRLLCRGRHTYQLSRNVRKPDICICKKTKMQISFAVTAKLISAFVFATRIVQSLDFLNPKFQAASYLLWLYSPVCVGPGRKPRRPVFSQRGSIILGRLRPFKQFTRTQVLSLFAAD